jgi:hypothetical protein
MHSTLGTYQFKSSKGKARMYWRLELVCIAISIYLLSFSAITLVEGSESGEGYGGGI